ncbi:ACT domain-containing protein [Sulfurimonas sp. CVO]|jgi:hypothetical protein|uniref:ACT domain-containing protein n=1 Tax=Sulfurimonas xiamenensis TaxID=2590021 RepID=A0AAJ4A239_9BACT|nr:MULTISPECIES: ACT domain-containing protein [Sulfurimonas]PLY13201.1 MAG: amino acid-binding protein [Sulfurimonas sp.]QFR42508.1 ACT domain-containing protein [Sulfurimonas xiamenensis]QHG91915.1 ACT domain-containing protein [Sulfurimonas sp. CVO]
MSRIKQLSIFVENKKGELTDVTTLLSKNNISIKSINLVDSEDFGILKLIVDDEKKAKEILDEAGFSLKITDVFAVAIDDHVGSFNDVVSALFQNDINIEYTYTVSNAQNGAFIFKVDINDFQKALQVLSKADVELLEKI